MEGFRDSASKLVRRAVRSFRDESVFRVMLALLAVLHLIAVCFYMSVERMSLTDANYFSIMLVATVGDSNMSPKTAVGKWFTAVYTFAGTGTFLGMVTGLAQAIVVKQHKNEKK